MRRNTGATNVIPNPTIAKEIMKREQISNLPNPSKIFVTISLLFFSSLLLLTLLLLFSIGKLVLQFFVSEVLIITKLASSNFAAQYKN